MEIPATLLLPFTGTTPISRHCSYLGARKGSLKAGSQADRILGFITTWQPVTDHELVELSGLPLNIVNARTGGLRKIGKIQRDGWKPGPWGTKNSCWVTKEAQ